MTTVTYPQGSVEERSRIVDVAQGALITETTCFHPVDHAWPDQPADTGTLAGREVTDAVLAAREPGGQWHLGADIPVKRGSEGWEWAVAHIVADTGGFAAGDEVDLAVDADARAALSVGHTACHLAALALNRAVADLWSKEARTDSLGASDFDGAANQASRILPNGAEDDYRLGKSLRKSGVDTAGLLEQLPDIQQRVNAQLAEWIAEDAPVRIAADGPALTDMRRWECELADGTASIPCGGTHVTRLGELGTVTVELTSADPQSLTMRTSATGA